MIKETKRKYKNACKGIRSLHTALNELSIKNEKFIETHENLYEENKVLKHNFENQNRV